MARRQNGNTGEGITVIGRTQTGLASTNPRADARSKEKGSCWVVVVSSNRPLPPPPINKTPLPLFPLSTWDEGRGEESARSSADQNTRDSFEGQAKWAFFCFSFFIFFILSPLVLFFFLSRLPFILFSHRKRIKTSGRMRPGENKVSWHAAAAEQKQTRGGDLCIASLLLPLHKHG